MKNEKKVDQGVPASQSLAVGLFAVSPPPHTEPPVAEDAAAIPHAPSHTPGQWTFDLAHLVGGPTYEVRPHGEGAPVVARISSWRSTRDNGEAIAEAQANVRLIAAAPDLLAALRTAETALAIKSSLRDGEQKRCQAALDQVRAAITKAEGKCVTE